MVAFLWETDMSSFPRIRSSCDCSGGAAGVQILANMDSKWTPRDLFRDGERASNFVSLCFIGFCFGGPGRVRTVDLFHAMEARSQLRHRPTSIHASIPWRCAIWKWSVPRTGLAGLAGERPEMGGI